MVIMTLPSNDDNDDNDDDDDDDRITSAMQNHSLVCLELICLMYVNHNAPN